MKNKRGRAIIIVGIIILLLGGIIFFSVNKSGSNEENLNQGQNVGEDLEQTKETPNETDTSENTSEITESETETPQTYTIEYTSSGFEPSEITISSGDSITFLNTISTNVWPASNVHPSHTVYPNSGINKCGTSEESEIFDSCKGLSEGESYTFTFNEIGTWSYHNHLRASKTGKIIVQ